MLNFQVKNRKSWTWSMLSQFFFNVSIANTTGGCKVFWQKSSKTSISIINILLIDPFSLNQISPDKTDICLEGSHSQRAIVLALTCWRRKHKGSHTYQHRKELGVKCQSKKNLVTSDSGFSPQITSNGSVP